MKSTSKQQIQQKSFQFSQNIRNKHRHDIFANIRKQFSFVYSTPVVTNSSSKIPQNTHQQLLTQNTQTPTKQYINKIDSYPLISKTLQKFSQIPHPQIWNHIPAIISHLAQNNKYLSIIMKQQQQQKMQQESVQGLIFDQQSLLIHDLFYLTIQHSGSFRLPRCFQFVRNGSLEVASYVAAVSDQILPDQLAYWMDYMNKQDRSMTYYNIIGADQYQYQIQQAKNTKRTKYLHYMSWVNHPTLRNYLISDFAYKSSAVSAIRQLICIRKLHPNRFINKKGQYIEDILCKIFHQQLQGMIKSNANSNSNNIGQSQSQDSFSNISLCPEFLQIAIKIIQIKKQDNQKCNELYGLTNKIIQLRIQSQTKLITPLFCQWLITALLHKNIQLLTNQNMQIIYDLIVYDYDGFVIGHRVDNQALCQCKIGDPCGFRARGKVCQRKFWEFQSKIVGLRGLLGKRYDGGCDSGSDSSIQNQNRQFENNKQNGRQVHIQQNLTKTIN